MANPMEWAIGALERAVAAGDGEAVAALVEALANVPQDAETSGRILRALLAHDEQEAKED